MEETDLDSILLTVENHVRRKIIKRLSQEPSYQLQISKELGFSQQLVAKHLDSMEGKGVVSSLMESSPHGPMRKEYLLNKSVSLTIDFAPNLFRAKMMSFDAMPETLEKASNYGLTSKVNEAIRQPDDKKIGPLGSMIGEIDKRLSDLEDEKSVLLYVRHLTMKEVTKVIAGMNLAPEKKRILYHVIAEQDKDVKGMSRALGLREEVIETLLADLDKELHA
jgi:predicted transcriptional regulator